MSRHSNTLIRTDSNADLSIGNGLASSIDSSGFPLILAPDGHVSWPITDYLLHKTVDLKKAKGTIDDYARSLSLFSRFHGKEQAFELMDDNKLIDYRDYLSLNTTGSPNQINSHINKAIAFLQWLDHILRKNSHVPRRKIIALCYPDQEIDAQIIIYLEATLKNNKTKNSFFNKPQKKHAAFLIGSIRQERKPISDETIDKLWSAIPKVFKGELRRIRTELAFLLFESIGARRGEIFGITLEDSKNAINSNKLKIQTLKKKNISFRELPLELVTISRLKQYINLIREPIIKSAIANKKIPYDHGKLFITQHGTAYKAISFNEEINKLAAYAGIQDPTHPHLFRNKFFTKLASNSSHLDRSKQLSLLTQTGGWSSDLTPATYIDLNELEGDDIKNTIEMNLRLQSSHAAIHIIKTTLNKLRSTITEKETINVVNELECLFDNLILK